MAGIFISYRRSDSAGYTGRLMDDIKVQFPDNEVFRDVEAIEAGADFVEAIDGAVKSCSVLLAVIGPRWLSVTDNSNRRRIDDPHDFVRLEIAAALRREVRVIPVLVDGAIMPPAEDLPEDIKALARRQAQELTDKRWDYDVGLLFTALEKVPGMRRKRAEVGTSAAPPPKKMSLGKKIGIGSAVLLALGVVGEFMPEDSTQPSAPTSLPTAVLPSPSAAPSPPSAHEPASPSRREPVAQPVARAPAALSAAVDATPAPPAAAEVPVQPGDQSCGRPASVAGTWQWAIGDGTPGILVITQQADALSVTEFNALGMQVGTGNGSVCGRDVSIQVSNALLGQFSLATRISGANAMSGTIFYQGQQAAVQAMRQG
jgi:hypothetical protein